MDKKDLKIEALTQRIAELTAGYENVIADLRVELTILAQGAEDVEVATERPTGPLSTSQDKD